MSAETGLWPREVLDEIRARADIVAIASERVTLKRAGSAHKGLCPFHDEKTPSFHVNPSRGLFKCFGCGAGGDVFALVQRLDGMTFPEAVRALAARTGVRLPELRRDEGATLREAVREVLDRAADFFHRFLTSKGGSEAREYCKKRGISASAIDTFRIGLAPSGRSVLYNKVRGRWPDEVLDASGLFGRREDGGRFDRFRGRLIFPVCDAAGRIVGFGGRALADGSTKDGPKYLNSPETEIFRKGEVLYGLHLARDAARRAGRVVLVEGYVDVVLCHEAGIGEAVAPLGTAFTEAQARLVKRYADRIVFALDADAAGARAADRGIETALGAGLEVRVAVLPAGADPADLVASGRGAELSSAIDGAAEYVAWRIETAAAGARDAAGRAAAARALVRTIAGVPDPIARAAHARAAAGRLGLDEEVLRREVDLSRGGAAKGSPRPPGPPSRPTSRPVLGAEATFVRIVLDGDEGVRRLAAAVVAPDDLADPALGALYAAILEAAEAGEAITGDIGGRLDAAGVDLLAAVGTAPAPPATLEEAAARAVRIRDRSLAAAIRRAGAAGDLERVRSAGAERRALQARVEALAAEIKAAGVAAG